MGSGHIRHRTQREIRRNGGQVTIYVRTRIYIVGGVPRAVRTRAHRAVGAHFPGISGKRGAIRYGYIAVVVTRSGLVVGDDDILIIYIDLHVHRFGKRVRQGGFGVAIAVHIGGGEVHHAVHIHGEDRAGAVGNGGEHSVFRFHHKHIGTGGNHPSGVVAAVPRQRVHLLRYLCYAFLGR